MKRAMAGLFGALVLWSADAQAQGSPLDFFRHNQQGSPFFWRQERTPPPLSRPRPRLEPRDSNRVRSVAPPVRDERPVVAETVVVPTHHVHVIGDSLAELLAQGLKDRLAEVSPGVVTVRRTRSSSGLVRDDYHDWPKALAELFAGPDPVDLIVIMMGSNDRQALRDETGAHEFRTERWQQLYAKRIDALLAMAREKQVPVQWIGMPIMQAQRLSADMVYLNAIARERVLAAGGTYTDLWEAFAGSSGEYAAVGPDTSGQTARLRTADGIHFTRAGIGKLGFFAARDTVAMLGPEKERPAIAALPQDLSDKVKEGTQVTPSAPAYATTIPLPGSLEGLPLVLERPASGPVLELTAPARSPEGRLLQNRPLAYSNADALAVEQALAHGVPPAAKPGRTDDYRWQRGTTGSLGRAAP